VVAAASPDGRLPHRARHGDREARAARPRAPRRVDRARGRSRPHRRRRRLLFIQGRRGHARVPPRSGSSRGGRRARRPHDPAGRPRLRLRPGEALRRARRVGESRVRASDGSGSRQEDGRRAAARVPFREGRARAAVRAPAPFRISRIHRRRAPGRGTSGQSDGLGDRGRGSRRRASLRPAGPDPPARPSGSAREDRRRDGVGCAPAAWAPSLSRAHLRTRRRVDRARGTAARGAAARAFAAPDGRFRAARRRVRARDRLPSIRASRGTMGGGRRHVESAPALHGADGARRGYRSARARTFTSMRQDRRWKRRSRGATIPVPPAVRPRADLRGSPFVSRALPK